MQDDTFHLCEAELPVGFAGFVVKDGWNIGQNHIESKAVLCGPSGQQLSLLPLFKGQAAGNTDFDAWGARWRCHGCT